MNMIDKYVAEIGKNLPRKMRADIESEIRSTLQDMLDDRSKQEGRPIDDSMIKEVITNYGSPEKVAASYMPARYLIGPRLYPVFMLVLKIVFTVLIVLGVVGFVFLASTSHITPQSFLEMAGKTFLQFYTGAIAAFGNIVIIFAIIDWAMRSGKEKEGQETWNPDKLLSAPDSDEVGMWSPILNIFFSVIVILIFNIYPQVIGINFTSNFGWFLGVGGYAVSIPLLSDAFFSYLPWLNLLWGLNIILNLLLLRRRRWQPSTRWFSIGIQLAGVILAFVMLTGPSLIGITATELARAGQMALEAAGVLVTMINQLVNMVLILIIILNTIDIGKSIYRLVIKRPTLVIPTQS
jgi:hypothetical protein